MHFFISFVLIYAGNRISAEMFQTSRTDSISNLTKVDGQTVFSSNFLLFDVKSCNKVQFVVNFDNGMARMDIYPNRSLQVQYCYKGLDCTVEMFTVTGDTCDGYTPLWVQVQFYGVVIGEGCDVEESQLSSSPWLMLLYGNTSIGISSADDAWWRLGESACKPVTTPATTTTLTTHSTTTPATTSEAPGSLVIDTTKNETMHNNVNMGRSGGAVCNNSLAVMTMAATWMFFLKY
ncbi:uncharacterized protein LOC124141316 [Haliotis rufescens]|uniref:uncharacterized protein LOC124141316 n=1 Tax=Haliotis rufescens TaxID=6454 RepID=UPI00201ED835|nr:uncharacterized protein LOC124141316 [Haliotis rufescens]